MSKWYSVKVVFNRPVIVFDTYAEDDYDGERPIKNLLPADYVVCPMCAGMGLVAAWPGPAHTQQEQTDLEEGANLEKCPDCEGLRVVARPRPRASLTARQKHIWDKFYELSEDRRTRLGEALRELQMQGTL